LFFMVLVTFALVAGAGDGPSGWGTHTGKGLAALIREQFSLRAGPGWRCSACCWPTRELVVSGVRRDRRGSFELLGREPGT